MKKLFALALTGLLFIASHAVAQDQSAILRKWKTIDDDTGKPKSVVELYMENGKMYGRVLKLFREPHEDQDPICKECDEDDPRYNKRIIGMVIISDMVWDASEGEFEDGEILDPAKGSVYDCEIWIDKDTGNLRVRGYLYFLYRTQTWLPYDGD